jgi:hypothetical protein
MDCIRPECYGRSIEQEYVYWENPDSQSIYMQKDRQLDLHPFLCFKHWDPSLFVYDENCRTAVIDMD